MGKRDDTSGPPVVKSEKDFKKVLGALLTVPPVRNGDLKKRGQHKPKRKRKK